MINKKFSAYYLKDGEWIKIGRWDLLKLPETEYRKFKDKHFPLFQSKSIESLELTFNRAQKTFRFMPHQINDCEKEFKNLTITHILAQEVLAEIENLNFKLRDLRTKSYKEVTFSLKVDNSFIEKSLLNNSYRADLFLYFSEPADLALKWNNRVAVEVFVTNETGGEKIYDFEENSIPLIEVKLGKELTKYNSYKDIDEDTENKIRQHIFNSFKKQIYGSLLVSPTSKEYHKFIVENKIYNENRNLKEELTELQKTCDDYKKIIEKTENLIQTQNNNNARFDATNKELLIINNELKEKINHLENLSFMQKFLNLFN